MNYEEEEDVKKKSTESVKSLIPETVKRNLRQEASTERAAERNAAESKGSRVSDSFKEALTFFAPALLGGGIGAIFEGGAGAVEGIKQGQALGESFRGYKERQQARQDRLNLASLKPTSKDYVDSRTGKPVRRLQNGSIVDLSGKPVDPSNVVEGVTWRQSRSISQREKEEEAKQGRFVKNYGLNREKFSQAVIKDAQLSGKQQETIAGIAGVMRDIDEISRLKKETSTGPVAGRLQSLGATFGIASDEFIQLKSRTASVLANYVKSISGAQSSDREAVRLSAIIPSVNDSEVVFQNKLSQFKRINEANISGFSEALRSGQPLKKETVQAILQVLDKEEKPQKASERMSSWDEAKRKRYEEFKAKRKRK